MNLLTVREVAQIMRSSQQFVYNLCNSGELVSYRLGRGALRIDETDLKAYLAERRIEPPKRKRPARRFKSKHFS